MTCEFIYGINPAFEVVRAKRRAVEQAFFSAGGPTDARRRKLRELLNAGQVPVVVTDKRRLFDLCRTTEHQGIVLQTQPYPYARLAELQASERLLLIDNVEDPQNVGAILRSAEIFGWQNVLLAKRGTPEIYPSVVKAAAGATEYLRIARDHTANEYVKALLPLGFTLVALDARGEKDLERLRAAPPRKILLVIGGEHHAVGQHILNQAHHRVRIPRLGQITSLNASVAAGLALFLLQPRGNIGENSS
ncbi:MAG: RNA methyltransferase [Lentisphaerae bacterium]|nr:RNA methyltransferase [Lentisphaerota bacterium]